jgi:HD superfamily phosphodiesterase
MGLTYDPELLYVGAMFHDIGLIEGHRSAHDRFEVDGANAARAFLVSHGITGDAARIVWDAIALHTTPGIPQHKEPEVALVTAGVELDVLGFGYDDISPADRNAVLAAYPRVDFKESIIQAFADGLAHRPETAFGNVKADVLAEKLPGYERPNFCAMIRASKHAN